MNYRTEIKGAIFGILQKYMPCVPQLIEKIHFDPEHPENHNIKITNKKMNYAEIVKNNKWVTANKKKVIDDVIQKSYNLLDETYVASRVPAGLSPGHPFGAYVGLQYMF